MARRVYCAELSGDVVTLGQSEAHHVRDVLRLGVGAELELFDDAGTVARGVIEAVSAGQVLVRVRAVEAPAEHAMRLVIASAVPKGPRADWMIEKLSELGVDRFIPLSTARSVVHPEGTGKLSRWRRLATEAARQSRRRGTMQIDPLTELADLVPALGKACYLSTADNTEPLHGLLQRLDDREPGAPLPDELMLLIGPEGGWTEQEMAQLDAAGLTPAGLTATVLRVETAALAAAAIVAAWRDR